MLLSTDVSPEQAPVFSRVKRLVAKPAKVFVDKDTIFELVMAVRECLTVSSAVRSLVLEGVELRLKDIKCLVKVRGSARPVCVWGVGVYGCVYWKHEVHVCMCIYRDWMDASQSNTLV